MSEGALREIAASFGIEWDDSKLQKGVQGIDGAVGVVRQFVSVIAGAEVVRGIEEFVTGLTETGSALNDASDRLGVTTKDLQELQFAAGQAGVRGEQLNAALSGLSIRAQQAKAGTGPAAEAFRALGLKATDAHGQVLPVSDLLTDIASGMTGIVDPARRVQLATQLFGGAGRRLVGILHDGEGGIEDLRGQLEELGGGMSDDAVHAADDFGDALDRNKAAMLSLKSTVGVLLLPALTKITDWLSHTVANFTRITRDTHTFQLAGVAAGAALAAAAAPVLAAWLPAIAPFAAGALAIGGLILLVDDLWTAFQGGDSVTGRIVDDVEGINSMRDAVAGAQLVWSELGTVLRHVWEQLQDILNSIPGVNRAMSALGIGPQGDRLDQLAERRRRDDFDASEQRALTEGVAVHAPGSPVLVSHGRGGRLDNKTVSIQQQAVAVPAGSRDEKAPVVHQNNTTTATIQIHSNQDPAAIARAVDARLRAREQAQHDADHPIQQREQ